MGSFEPVFRILVLLFAFRIADANSLDLRNREGSNPNHSIKRVVIHALDRSGESKTRAALDAPSAVVRKYDRELDAHVAVVPNRHDLTYPTRTLQASDSSGNQLGYIQYGVMGPGNISIEMLSISEKFKGKGVSKVLLASVLREKPDTQSIFAILEFDNLKVFKEGIKNGFSEEEALKSTPMYKAADAFGYSKLLQYGVKGKAYFILEKR